MSCLSKKYIRTLKSKQKHLSEKYGPIYLFNSLFYFPRKKTKKKHTQTFSESCEMHLSKAVWRSDMDSVLLELDASAWFWRHLRKCFTRSAREPTIATEACCFALFARFVVTLIIFICKSGCLITFLWSKCLTSIDNKRWEFCPGDQEAMCQSYPRPVWRKYFN